MSWKQQLADSDRGSIAKMSNGPMNCMKVIVKAPRRSWDLLVKSSSGPTKKINQNPRTQFLLFMMAITYTLNYSDFMLTRNM